MLINFSLEDLEKLRDSVSPYYEAELIKKIDYFIDGLRRGYLND